MAVEYKKEGRIATITLNRPEALNAFDPAQIDQFNKCIYDFNNDNDLWVAIVTATGERAFSVGADIRTTLPKIQTSAHRGGDACACHLRGYAGLEACHRCC